MAKVLIVEDDDKLAELVRYHVEDAGFEVERAADGQKGLELAQSGEYGLIILDLMLPVMSGNDVCREIRKNDDRTAIMMLTAKTEEMDKVLGLELGADDYMTKPFGGRELVARNF